MKKLNETELEGFAGGQWYYILECLAEIGLVADVELYTALELCALSEKYAIN